MRSGGAWLAWRGLRTRHWPTTAECCGRLSGTGVTLRTRHLPTTAKRCGRLAGTGIALRTRHMPTTTERCGRPAGRLSTLRAPGSGRTRERSGASAPFAPPGQEGDAINPTGCARSGTRSLHPWLQAAAPSGPGRVDARAAMWTRCSSWLRASEVTRWTADRAACSALRQGPGIVPPRRFGSRVRARLSSRVAARSRAHSSRSGMGRCRRRSGTRST